MDGNHKFFKCGLCGNLVGLIEEKGPTLVCCGQDMDELVPNTVEASTEKHLPAVTVDAESDCCINVQVGSVPHPMEEGHHISFVFVETNQGGQRKNLKVGAEPKSTFCVVDDKPTAAYAYCNLHGLWKTEI